MADPVNLRSDDPGRPSNLSPEVEAHIARLEAIIERQRKPVFVGWPIERWLTAITLVVLVLGGVVATVIRWHDIDLVTVRLDKLEQRFDSFPDVTNGLYARKDLYDERLKVMNDKLDSLLLDMKAVREHQVIGKAPAP